MKSSFLILFALCVFLTGDVVKKNKIPALITTKNFLKEQNHRLLYNILNQDEVKTQQYLEKIDNGLDRLVFVDIKNQRLTLVSLVDTFKISLRTTISSGKKKDSTPRGSFKILKKRIARPSKKYGGVMTFWNCLTLDESIGIHGLRDRSYESKLGEPVSHGCIRISKSVEKDFYKLAPIGTEVLIE